MKTLYILFFLGLISASAQHNLETQFIDIESKLIEWRCDFHQNTEHSNQEFKTTITYNNYNLIKQMLPSLGLASGNDNVIQFKAETIGEDFSYFQEEIPGFYFYLGGMTKGNTKLHPHHTPRFYIDESGLILGVKALTQMTLDYLNEN